MATFKLDTKEFDRTANIYAGYTKRDVATICNTKAFYIARRTVVETVKEFSTPTNNKIRIFFSRQAAFSDFGRIMGMTINKRRGRQGDKGLYGPAMMDAQLLVKAARLRSTGFIASGWIWAIKTLKPLAEKIGSQNVPAKSKNYGQSKGEARPAHPGWNAFSIIKNLATATHTSTPDALHKFGGPPLQRAIDFETASMKSYIERKMKQSLTKAGIKHH